MREEEIRAEHFRQAEASLLLEGMDSSKDEFYQAAKARVIAGEISIDEMMRLMIEDCKLRSKHRAAEMAIAS
jgi:hypothetical protein